MKANQSDNKKQKAEQPSKLFNLNIDNFGNYVLGF